MHNAYAIYGTEDAPAHFPPALQVDPPFGVDIGGTPPAFWPLHTEAEYDSWLSVGVDDGSAAPGDISSIGIKFEGAWSCMSSCPLKTL